jgi:hypothetical protein
MLRWAGALKRSNYPLCFDSKMPQQSCVISHAHADHLAHDQRAWATAATAEFAAKRTPFRNILQLAYGEIFHSGESVI